MIRAVYVDATKRQWDSLGNRESYRLDRDSPCVQPDPESESEIPDTATEFFETDIDSYKSRVESNARDTSIDSSVEDRLEDLGYR